jgi:hypothetical protein
MAGVSSISVDIMSDAEFHSPDFDSDYSTLSDMSRSADENTLGNEWQFVNNDNDVEDTDDRDDRGDTQSLASDDESDDSESDSDDSQSSNCISPGANIRKRIKIHEKNTNYKKSRRAVDSVFVDLLGGAITGPTFAALQLEGEDAFDGVVQAKRIDLIIDGIAKECPSQFRDIAKQQATCFKRVLKSLKAAKTYVHESNTWKFKGFNTSLMGYQAFCRSN